MKKKENHLKSLLNSLNQIRPSEDNGSLAEFLRDTYEDLITLGNLRLGVFNSENDSSNISIDFLRDIGYSNGKLAFEDNIVNDEEHDYYIWQIKYDSVV
jgi:hypothetical protein